MEISSFGGMIRLVVSLAVCQAAGLIGSLFTRKGIDPWYSNLQKPSFTPPDWVFAPVWITLYLLMGISLFLVWLKVKRESKTISSKGPMVLFFSQLALNVAWTAVFFGMHSIGWSLLVICLLWIMIIVTMIFFYRISSLASWLLLPYLLWVSYATVLNLNIWWLNLQ